MISHTHTYIYILYYFSFHYGLLQDIQEHSSLYYAVGPCCLLFLFFSNWSINALRCFYVETNYMSQLGAYIYTYVYIPFPSLTSLPHPTPPIGHHRAPSWVPCAIQKLPTSCFTHVCHVCTYVCIYVEKAMAPHSSTLAWKIPWMEEPGRLQSMGSRRVRHSWATSLLLFTFMHWRRQWQPTPVFLPGESQG